jgi:hypothetical protein
LKQWANYKSRVLERASLSCRSQLWPFEYNHLKVWLSNFTGPNAHDKDELVALYLLDRLVVRTRKSAHAGYSRLFMGEIRRSLLSLGILSEEDTIDAWKEAIRTRPTSKGINFIPIHSDDGFGESGSTLFRHLHGLIRTDLGEIDQPKAVIYIDDCLGSGDQFIEFVNNSKPQEKFPDAAIFYCPLIAHNDGLNKIKDQFPSLNIFPVEIVDDEIGPFSQNEYSDIISEYLDISIVDLKAHYIEMFDRYCGASGFRAYWNSYEDLEMPIVFEWGCPNNALGILYMDHSRIKRNWKQLFPRRS